MTTSQSEQPSVRLLLVDDEPGLRSAVQAYLEDEGFDVTTAVDGEDGFTKAQQMLPDVVISDVMMMSKRMMISTLILKNQTKCTIMTKWTWVTKTIVAMKHMSQ